MQQTNYYSCCFNVESVFDGTRELGKRKGDATEAICGQMK
jgi:hypothetical protein